tara:strand:- start:258 stop:545 length:288 start_codon:yes stop_codon:yes gene_type:complete
MKKSDDLDTRLKIAKSKLESSEIKTDRKKGVFLGNAFKLGTELVAAVAVGSIIGFILDNWFGTKPLLIILFFLFGSAAGIYNVIKAAKKMQENKE